ncbi:MAG: hypothetical protein JEZ12_11810 [Desulfobacterium sp.]|nr:hypothetical protein [Desulfobacterium sp.]
MNKKVTNRNKKQMGGLMSSATKERTGLLMGKKEIQAFLNDMPNHTLMKLMADGLPVRILEGGRWIAHKENLETFFMKYAKGS